MWLGKVACNGLGIVSQEHVERPVVGRRLEERIGYVFKKAFERNMRARKLTEEVADGRSPGNPKAN